MSDKPVDYYEVLQISPNAEGETIQRVFRMLARRYHPDNPETGNDDRFRELHEAYTVLSDPVTRARYDVDYQATRAMRFKAFTSSGGDGRDSERTLRHSVLSVLYAKRRSDPGHPGVSPLEVEQLVGRPREHLEFTFWFLKEKGFVVRTDESDYVITVSGVEYLEEAGLGGTGPGPTRLLEPRS
jgi:curved DNA-binding protein CbpA